MKLFSWSSLFFILSLSFLWGCGYWVWVQTNHSQQVQLYSQLSLQLERSEVLLEDWQRNYRLHLDYLRADLAKMTPQSTDNEIYDPRQELDDKIQHAPWPDALLGYALLDEAGRAIRLSNNVAGQLFTITNTDFSSNHQFLTPMVLPALWVAPVHLELNGQHLLFWFDLAALKQKLLKAQQQAAGEVLLVSAATQLVSPSRYQQTLLARFGMSDLREDQSLKFQLKRPPEDLTRSKQRYDGSMAWPVTQLAQLMSTKRQGQTPLFVPNYIGRPSVASWRWSDGWQAYLVAERDLSSMQQQRKTMRQYLLIGLSGLSAVLLLLFWLIQRGMLQPHSQSVIALPGNMPVPNNTDQIADDLAVSAPNSEERVSAQQDVMVSMMPTDSSALGVAGELMRAWLNDSAAEPLLKMASQRWLQQYAPEQRCSAGCQLRLQITLLLTGLQKQLATKELLLDIAADVPEWAELDMRALCDAMSWVIHFRAEQHDVSTLLIKALQVEPNQLRLEIADDGESVAPGQWLTLLQPAQDATQWPEPLKHLKMVGGHLSAAQPQFSGNKLLLTIPMQLWRAQQPEVELQLVDGSALLLCPAGEAQQLYRRTLKQTGLALMPLDDAEQFMQWCSVQNDARLDYLILDENFINADLQIAARVFQIVRRYFPQLVLIVLAREPQQWQALLEEFQLRVISKPVCSSGLQQALIADKAQVLQPHRPTIWLEATDSLADWTLRQQLLQLGYAPAVLTVGAELPEQALLMLTLESRTTWDKQLKQQAVLWYTSQPVALDAQANELLVWTSEQGIALLSRRLFQLSERLITDEN